MKKLAFALGLFLVLVTPAQASAHVFFKDLSGTYGIMMHATPDDDPIAGEATSAFFTIQDNRLNTDTHYYRLYVVNSSNMQFQAATYQLGVNSVGTQFTYPEQGTYMLELQAFPIYNAAMPNADRTPITFQYTQRVSRGRIVSPLDEPRYAWAEFGLLFSICGIVVLSGIVINRRRIILAFTKWR